MPVKQDIYTIMENMDNTIVTLENEYNTLENKFTFNTDNKVTSTTTQIKLRTISKVENKSTNIKDQIEHKQNIIASLTDKLESLLNKISFN
jgi:predicted P-loop ATPase